MLSFLRNGDIHNTIRQITNLPGLFTDDGNKIKYAVLNHSMTMRANISVGVPIFTNIISRGCLPSMAANAAAAATTSFQSSLTPDSSLRNDNAALALIMAKELAFLNRTIQMISLIAARYQEEQDDLLWGRDVLVSSEEQQQSPYEEEDLEYGYAGDDTPSIVVGGGGGALQRSQSHDFPEIHAPQRNPEISNQLSSTFLIASGHLMQRFNGLCELQGTSVILVNAMTTMDKPHNEDNRAKQFSAQSLVISDIFLHFGKFGAEHRDPVVLAFLELRDISVSAWKIMSMFAFSNLFRLTAGSEFTMFQPDDAIFAQGRETCQQQQQEVIEHRCVSQLITETEATETTEATEGTEYD